MLRLDSTCKITSKSKIQIILLYSTTSLLWKLISSTLSWKEIIVMLCCFKHIPSLQWLGNWIHYIYWAWFLPAPGRWGKNANANVSQSWKYTRHTLYQALLLLFDQPSGTIFPQRAGLESVSTHSPSMTGGNREGASPSPGRRPCLW